MQAGRHLNQNIMQKSLCLTALGIALMLSLTPGKAQQAKTGFQPSPVTVTHTVDTVLGNAYFVHEVQKGHTLYSICKAYKVDASQILKDSPENEVQIGEHLYIPLDASLINDMEPLEKFQGKRPWAVVFLERGHKEDARYATDMGDKNRKSDRGQGKREKRRQKAKDREETVAVPEMPETIADTTSRPAEENTADRATGLKRKAAKDSLQISLLLPLYSDMPESRQAYIYLPFFEGASIAWIDRTDSSFFAMALDSCRMAADSASMPADSLRPSAWPSNPGTRPSPVYAPRASKKDPGLKFNLYDIAHSLYATDQFSRSLQQTLADPALQESDVIVAGAFVNQFPLIDSFSRKHQIPLIHPFSERDSMAVGNPWFMQLSASTSTQIHEIAEWITRTFPDTAVLAIITDSSLSEKAKSSQFQRLLPGSKRYLFNPVTEILLQDLIMDTQVVIVPFYQEEITAVKTFLPLRQGKGNITMIAPASWLEYSTTDIGYFLQNNLTVYSTFLADPEGKEFKEFARKYRIVYNGLPNSMAYQGYLLFDWLIGMLREYNADFMRHITEADNPFFLQERTGAKGFESSNVRIFRLKENGLEEASTIPGHEEEIQTELSDETAPAF